MGFFALEKEREKKLGKVIAIVNQKGGVGKTTTTLNLGVGLVRKGRKILLVDADPQGSLTKSLGYRDNENISPSLADHLMGIISDESIDFAKGILHQAEGVDLIPANINLAAIDIALVDTLHRELVLKKFIDFNRNKYDFILIDCMPSLGMLTINSLCAADSVIIPVQPDYLSVSGLQQLLCTIFKVRNNLNRNLQIDGILLTLAQLRTNLSRDIIYLINSTYKNKIRVFKAVIPYQTSAREASAAGQSIYNYKKNSNVSKAYSALVDEVGYVDQ